MKINTSLTEKQNILNFINGNLQSSDTPITLDDVVIQNPSSYTPDEVKPYNKVSPNEDYSVDTKINIVPADKYPWESPTVIYLRRINLQNQWDLLLNKTPPTAEDGTNEEKAIAYAKTYLRLVEEKINYTYSEEDSTLIVSADISSLLYTGTVTITFPKVIKESPASPPVSPEVPHPEDTGDPGTEEKQPKDPPQQPKEPDPVVTEEDVNTYNLGRIVFAPIPTDLNENITSKDPTAPPDTLVADGLKIN